MSVKENNIAYLGTPHYNSSCFRVAVNKQQGKYVNFIVVCCSPEYNGVWKGHPERKNQYSKWNNNKQICYCVPISECDFVQTLDTIKNKDIIKEIKKNQKAFIGDYRKREDFPGML